MSLSVTVKSASSLPNVERFSKSDPMTVLTLQGQKKKTKVIDNELDPVWNETVSWEVPSGLNASEVLKIEIYDHETVGKNRILGTLDLSLREVIQRGKHTVSAKLKGKKGDLLDAKINMDLSYTSPAGTGGGEGGEGGGGGGGGEDEDEEDAQPMTVGGGGGEEEGGEEGDEGGEGGDGGEGGEAGGPGSSSERKHRARRRKKGGAKRANLPNKVTDFQVRVHILEARRLVGGGLNPVVKVVCGQEVKETSTQKGTNSPTFDDTLYFNLRERPEEMFDEVCEIKLLNAKKLLRDSLIGSFKFDLGLVYDEPGHAFIHKWLLLTDPNDAAGGVKGYLKFSINVLGPGDDPVPSPSELTQETVDIEANLLRPSGVQLVAATLNVRVFRGEDMPQMDPGYFEGVKKFLHVGTVQKELVDPYLTVSFAGHKGSTQVIWNETDPEWNHQINLGVRFPSMCERMRFMIKDKDKLNKDDPIGTCYVRISEISAPGDSGFLPTFGPCFVNIYGSPREFTDLPDKFEYLNKGLIEGVAYRGRVMLELDMSLGKLPTDKHEEIKLTDQKRIMPYLRRRKYKLYGAFFHATMVTPQDGQVEFEVSIGNYGNKLDEGTLAQPSTTPPTNPVSDGTAYYYLPWVDQKPCVQVESQWEDCSYRIDSLNILLHTAASLEEGLAEVKKLMDVDDYDTDTVKSQLGEVLDGFSENIYQLLPDCPTVGFTRLDRELHASRSGEWSALREESGHLRRELTTHKLEDMVSEVEDYIARIRCLAVEPQNSVPDVIIWMLAGNKRVAVERIPSHLLMHSSRSAKACGKFCGRLQTIFLTPPAVQKVEELEDLKDGAQVRLLLWLGLEKDCKEWTKHCPGGEVATFAETYENEACLFGRWGTTGLTRPNWSDARGKVKQPQTAFEPAPDGWQWDGEWKKSPELSIAFEPDEGLDEWTEDIFEYQLRFPFGSWPPPTNSYWADIRGDKLVDYDGKQEKPLSRDDIKAQDGWLWKGDWKKDNNRAVDEDGWEYAVEAGLGAWVPYERNVYLSRRCRWVRLRCRDKDSKAVEKKKRKRAKAMEEGWEYARLAHLTYHITEHRLDFARRRRWVRKLINKDPSKPAIFRFKGKKEKKKKDDEEGEESKQQVPRMYLTFKDCHTYQLRAYLYQARDMHSSDKSGLSDPYALMSFSRYSSRSRVVKESVSPTWDQTLLIPQIRLFGTPLSILESPPPIVLEFFDKDTIGENEYLGKTVVVPTVRLSMDTAAPRLDWYGIERYTSYAGELLGAFELLLDEGGDLPFSPPKAMAPLTHFIVPSGIRPVLQRTRLEVLCWGVREMKRFQLLKVTSPLVELECGGIVIKSEPIKDASKNPNFPKPVMSFDVYLPKEELYAPPLNLRILDKRSFGRLPLVGLHIIKSLRTFHVKPVMTEDEKAALTAAVQASTPPTTPAQSLAGSQEDVTAIPLEEEPEAFDTDPDSQKKTDFDWWTKYYYSLGDERRTQQEYVKAGYDRLVVYPNDLEEAFNRFTDLAQTFPLHRGKGSRDPDELGGQTVGFFKGSVKMYPLPDDGSPEPERILVNIPPTGPVDVVVRVYVIRAFDLQPQDPDGKSDPYLKVQIGKSKISDKDNYVPSNLNPVFGKMFELPATLPLDHKLVVKVMDWDRISADDLIGETVIDLENRFLSQYRAVCGLPETFSKRGPNKWRDSELPVKLLENWCLSNHCPEPEWGAESETAGQNTKLTIKGTEYKLSQFEQRKGEPNPDIGDPQQRLALHFLRQQNLVPEHVENRTLYNPLQPNISQGSLYMWVDMFPKSHAIPPPIDVSPRKPERYVLRIVVWNTKDVVLDEVSVVTGEAMSDIYVKAWLRGQDDTHKTDVHYRSMDGEGNFNWRLVFPFEYLPSEQVMVVRKKEHFYSLTTTERHVAPKLTVQVWDNDLFNPDDFLGTVDFDLTRMPDPVQNASDCSVLQLPDETREVKTTDLFKRKRLKGWWPVYSMEDGDTRELMGKVEMEMEVVALEDAQLRPAGPARDDPNMNPVLDPPNRPATSFLWFTSPLKTFKHIIWRYYKWHIIGGIIAVLLVVIIIIFIYTAPSSIMTWMTDAILP